MTSPKRVVGLDIGSNTVSCCMLQRGADGKVSIAKDVSLPVRLSEGLKEGHPLQKQAIVRALMALEKLQGEFEMGTLPVRVAGTAVLRMTSHPEHFLESAEEIIGTPVEIITGEQEAVLTSHGAIADLPGIERPVILDIGGQSTEISALNDNGEWDAVSMPLGVVSLTERFLPTPVPPAEEQAAASAHVREILQEWAPVGGGGGTLVCVGGTPTTLSMLERRLDGWHRDKVHGDSISKVAVEGWLKLVSTIPPQQRIDNYGMRPMRADVFPAGLIALLETMDHVGVDSITVSANGLRVGLALSLLD